MTSSPKQILEKIRHSSAYTDYERAFQTGLEMPLTIRPLETWGLPLQGCQNENPFCALLAGDRKGCAACLGMQQKLTEDVDTDPATTTCFAGFSETVVPIHHQGEAIGFLQTGQVRMAPATRAGFEAVHQKLTGWGSTIDRSELEKAYYATPAISPERYESMVALLKQFANHLELVTNQIVVQSDHAEPPLIQRARKFIEDNYSEEISLEQVARAVNTSTFYFCKVFKKATGLTFTEYLTRIRIETAKNLLLTPHVRISEAAFAVGFQSLSQFNRAFKRITGFSPTHYRANLPREGAMVA